jgi:hypothetical protein
MLSVKFALPLFILSAVLSACTSTIQIQVPQSAIPKFAECMKNPTSSYVNPKAEKGASNVFGYSLPNVATLATGNDQLFVTNDLLPANTSLLSSNNQWADKFRSTFNATSGELINTAGEVDALWNHPVHQAFLKAYNELSKTASPPLQPQAVKANELLDYMKIVRSVTEKNGWRVFMVRSVVQLSELIDSSADKKVIQLAAQKIIGSIFASTYLEAYFRNGQFAQLTWNLGNPLQMLQMIANDSSPQDRQIIQKLLDAIKSVDPNAAANLDKIINTNLSGTIGKIATAGFVTRGGDSLAMPAISISLDLVKQPTPLSITKVDTNAILEDVVRVTFEALFDAMNYIPAVTSATGVKLPDDYAAFDLPDFSKIKSAYVAEKSPMSADSFGKVDAYGGKVHALTASAMASLIRGINVVALNNEAIANTLTSVAATTARKVTERVCWCYFAVIESSDQGPNAGIYSHPLGDRTLTFDLKY